MNDIQVKDLKYYLTTRQPIRFDLDNTGESFVARIIDLITFENFFVIEIGCRNNELILRIKEET